MLVFPNCKINLGLNVVKKRDDGFHDLETVFYPVKWCDALEVIENESEEPFKLSVSGLKVEGSESDNLIYNAWKLITELKKLPPVKVHLHKNIPMGAGIGGGSSDAVFFVHLLDNKFDLKLTFDQKKSLASKLGSDCAFFLNSTPVFATGTGNVFSDIKLDLSSYYILLVHPGIHSNTKEAFNGLQPKKPAFDLKKKIETTPVNSWKDFLTNDFEATIFKKYPEIEALKNRLYQSGALYASMSGSGSAVYGIFDKKPALEFKTPYKYYLQLPVS